MAKKSKDTSSESIFQPSATVAEAFKNDTLHFLCGVILLGIALYIGIALFSFFIFGGVDQSVIDTSDLNQLSAVPTTVKNYAGAQGAKLANYLINGCFGVSSFMIPAFLLIVGTRLMKLHLSKMWKWFLCCSFLLIWISIFASFFVRNSSPTGYVFLGGMHGLNVTNWLVAQTGESGTFIILCCTAFIFLALLSAQTILIFRRILSLHYLKKLKKTQPTTAATTSEVIPEITPLSPAVSEEHYQETPPSPLTSIDDFEISQDSEEESYTPEMPANSSNPAFTVTGNSTGEDEEYDGSSMGTYNPTLDLENYKYPQIDLLKRYEGNDTSYNVAEQTANKDKIISTLRSFGIEISSIKATVGSTITLYEITPQAGVRISKIRGLENDIALSLSALGIRIIAPIPGKGTIGIEVPNSDPKIVSMHSIIASRKFQESTFELPIALGKTITNEIFMVDLCKMPHVLVAGATGQGKSVGLNAIITSLLYKKHPSQLKFVMIDPKKVEFNIYSAIEKHFLAKLPDEAEPIITDVTKVVQTLNSLTKEMDTRYDLLKMAHVRNVKEYNDKFINRRLNPNKGHKYMPYIVVIIDEFGDLIMTAGKEVELPIARIAQLARAVGIHMIIATQRPTTNIITGTIKANFPARVAFRVSSMIDSRTILDTPGANQLIGRGDLLFSQGSDQIRVQCAFVDTPEVERISEYIGKQQAYPTAFLLPETDLMEVDGTNSDVDMTRLDPMFEEAARLIVANQQGSTSLIQRKFSIGYNRAGRLMDQLEKAGIVGSVDGSKPRQVHCLTDVDLEMKLNNMHTFR